MGEESVVVVVVILCVNLLKWVRDLLTENNDKENDLQEEILQLKEDLLVKDDEAKEWKRRAVEYRKKYRNTDNFIKTYLTNLRQSAKVVKTKEKNKHATHNKRKSN